nr:MAG TPA: hypothetical protein [Caudoviricetes sp.]
MQVPLRAFGKIPFEHLTLNSYVKRFPKPLEGAFIVRGLRVESCNKFRLVEVK